MSQIDAGFSFNNIKGSLNADSPRENKVSRTSLLAPEATPRIVVAGWNVESLNFMR